jgi:hypothetical protein
MRDDAPIAEMMEIAVSTASLRERAQGLVQELDRWVPVDAAWLALTDPGSTAYARVASLGLDPPTLRQWHSRSSWPDSTAISSRSA